VASLGGRIQQFDTGGKFLGGIQSGHGKEAGQFSAPHGIAINAKGELFVADSYNRRIQKFATK
jgi:DNA-binding beta-propeller fold protein YncE